MGNRWKKVTAIMLAVLVTVQSIDWTGISSLIPVYGQEVPDGQNTIIASDGDNLEEDNPEEDNPEEDGELNEANTAVEPIGEELFYEEGVCKENLIIGEDSYLSGDLIIEGDLTISRRLQLNGHTLIVKGTTTISAPDSLLIVDGTYVAEKGLSITGGKVQFEGGSLQCNASLYLSYNKPCIEMTHEQDSFKVQGNFYIMSGYQGILDFEKGTLELTGDYLETPTSDGSFGGKGIQGGEEFRLLLSGEKSQMLDIQSEDTCILNVEMTGDESRRLYLPTYNPIQSYSDENCEVYEGIYRLTQEIFDFDWHNYDRLGTYRYDTVYLEEGDFTGAGHALYIYGDFYQNGNYELDGHMEVRGNYCVQKLVKEDGTVAAVESDGILKYKDGSYDNLRVYGDFVMASVQDHTDRMNNGALSVHGSLYQYGENVANFVPGKDFRIYFYGYDSDRGSKVIFQDTEHNWLPSIYNCSNTYVEWMGEIPVKGICSGRYNGVVQISAENFRYVANQEVTAHVIGDVVLQSDVTTGTASLILDGNLDLNGYSLACQNLIFSDGSSGSLIMEEPDSILTVFGDFYTGSLQSCTSLNQGTICFYGNVIQKNNGTPDNFVTGEQLQVRFVRENGTQSVSFDSMESRLYTVEIANGTDGYTRFQTDVNIVNLINTSHTLLQPTEGMFGYTLTEDVVIEGDLRLLGGTMNLDGHTLTVKGNVYLEDGSLIINKGTLLVEGDFRLQKYAEEEDSISYTPGSGQLIMEQTEDKVTVYGDFYEQMEKSYPWTIRNGTLCLEGNLYSESTQFGFGNDCVLELTGTESQTIESMSHTLKLGTLNIKNSTQVCFNGKVEVEAGLSDSGCEKVGTLLLYNLSCLRTDYVGDLEQIRTYNKDTYINRDISIDGTLILNNYCYLNGHSLQADTVRVNMPLYIEQGILDCKTLQMNNGIGMTSEQDTVVVEDMYVNLSSRMSEMNAGTLYIHGSFYEKTNSNYLFQPTGSHKTVFALAESYDGVPEIQFYFRNSRFQILQFDTSPTEYTSNRNAYSMAVEVKGNYGDEEAPSQPEDLTADSITYRNAVLKWNPSTDNDGILRYDIYRDDVLIGHTDQCTYRVSEMVQNTAYVYQVQAVDISGNLSKAEKLRIKTPKDTTPPENIRNFACTNRLTDSSVPLTWYSSSDDGQIVHYNLYRNGELLKEVTGTSYIDQTVEQGVLYTYSIEAEDWAGNVSEPSVYQVVPDNPPDMVELNGSSNQGAITVEWSSNDRNVKYYKLVILKGSQKVQEMTIDVNEEHYYSYTYVIGGEKETYECKVTPYSAYGQSAATASCTIEKNPDNEKPKVISISGLEGSVRPDAANAIRVEATDNCGIQDIVIKYRDNYYGTWIELEGGLQGDSKTEKYKEVIWEPEYLSRYYELIVIVTDTNNNKTSEIREILADCEGINTVEITEAVPGVSGVQLSWSYEGEEEVSYYQVEKLVENQIASNYKVYKNTVTIGSLYPDSDVTFQVTPVFKNQGRGLPSESVTVHTLQDIEAPVITDMYAVSEYCSTTANLRITAVDDASLAGCVLYGSLDGESWSKVKEDTYNSVSKTRTFYCSFGTKNLPEGPYYVKAVVYDYGENVSEEQIIEITIDHTPPVATEELNVYLKNEAAVLNWAEAKDEQVGYYEIYRKVNQYSFSRIGTVKTGTQYTDTGINPGYTYRYYVVTVDKAGNCSVPSMEYEISTLEDLEPPSVPQNVRATGKTGSSVQLQWSASQDDIQLEEYRIFRNGVLIQTTKRNSFYDTGLQTGKFYNYTVKAVDWYGNESEFSKELSVSTALPRINNIRPENYATLGTESVNITYYWNIYMPSGWYRENVSYSRDGREWTSIRNKESYCGSTGYQSTAYWNLDGLQDGSYQVRICITDPEGNEAMVTQTYYIDRTAAEPVQHLFAEEDKQVVYLYWDKSVSEDLYGYHLYRRTDEEEVWTKIADLDKDMVYYTDREVTETQSYQYSIAAYDMYDQQSETTESEWIQVSQDQTAPEVLSLMPKNQILTGEAVLQIQASDNRNVEKIRGEYYDPVSGNWMVIDEQAAEDGYGELIWNTSGLHGRYKVRILAYDAAGNENTTPYEQYYDIDNQGISKIQNLQGNVMINSVVLSWAEVTEDDFSYFSIEQWKDGKYEEIGTSTKVLGYQIENLEAETEYSFRVVGYDLTGNRGEPSDPVTLMTGADTVAPVISSISSTKGQYRFHDNLPIRVSAKDNGGLQSITLEYSQDQETWYDIGILDGQGRKNISCGYDFSTEELPEGSIYIRGIATDIYGNQNDRNQMIVEFIIDHTAPEQVTGLRWNEEDGIPVLEWNPTADSDIAEYQVQITDENGLVTTRTCKALYFEHRKAEPGKTYSYQVAAVDRAGNVGILSESVTGTRSADEILPQVHSLTPSEQLLQGTETLSAMVSDNTGIAEVSFYYREAASGDDQYRLIQTVIGKKENGTVSCKWDTSLCTDGMYQISVQAVDTAGNQSEWLIQEYELDNTAPDRALLLGTPGNYTCNLDWSREDLMKEPVTYELYRRSSEENAFRLIYSGLNETYIDREVSPALEYGYKLRTYDLAGNYSESYVAYVQPNDIDDTPPEAFITANSVTVEGYEIVLDGIQSTDNQGIQSFHWDFGDGTEGTGAKAKHIYTTKGTYTVTLTVTDKSGNTAEDTTTVKVLEKGTTGSLTITVVDEYGNLLPKATIYAHTDEEENDLYVTDEYGQCRVVAEAGTYQIAVFKDGYEAKESDITIRLFEEAESRIVLKSGDTVSGTLSVRKLEFEEMVEAGIDFSAPENQCVFAVSTTLEFEDTERRVIVTLVNRNGDCVGGSGDGGFGGGGGSGNAGSLPTTIVIPEKKQEDETQEEEGEEEEEPSPTIIRLNILHNISWLAEMYQVTLTVYNNAESSRLTLEDNTATLHLPEGIRLARTATPQHLTQSIETIRGGQTQQAVWYVAGKEPGTYELTASYQGMFMPFQVPVTAEFQSNFFTVEGGKGLVLYICPEEIGEYGEKYYVYFELVNEGKNDFYNIVTTFGGSTNRKYYRVSEESNGALPLMSNGDYISVPCLSPGESISGFYETEFHGNPFREDKHAFFLELLEHEIQIVQGENLGVKVCYKEVSSHVGIPRVVYKEVDVSELVADPVDTWSGAFMEERELLSMGDDRSFGITMQYNSRFTDECGEFGYGWVHNYESRLIDMGDGTVRYYITPNNYEIFAMEHLKEQEPWTIDENGYYVLDTSKLKMEQTYICYANASLHLERTSEGIYILKDEQDTTYTFTYEGNMTGITNAEGRTVTIDRTAEQVTITDGLTGRCFTCYLNANGLVETVADSAGRSVHLYYDESGRLTVFENAIGERIYYTYDENNRILTGSYQNGVTYVTNTYDEKGRVLTQDDGLEDTPLYFFEYSENEETGYTTTKVTNRLGKTCSYEYDFEGNCIRQMNEKGDTLTHTYDSEGNETSSIDANGNVKMYEYDDNNQLISVTDAYGIATYMTYDRAGRLIDTHNSSGEWVKIEYNEQNLVAATTDQNGNRTTYTYNEAGQVTSETNEAGTITYAYTGGEVTQTTDRLGNITYAEYDSTGRLTASSDAYGTLGTFAYDALGRVIQQTDASGGTTSYTYDIYGNIRTVTKPDGGVTTYEYNSIGWLTRITEPDGSVLSYTVNSEGWINSLTDSLGRTKTYEYDAVGNVTAETDQEGNRTEYTYDGGGSVLTATDSQGVTTATSYYPNGKVASQTDETGNRTIYTYEQNWRISNITSDTGAAVSYEYDKKGNLTARIDAMGSRTEYTYDKQGNVLTVTDPMGGITAYNYDANGNVTGETDALGNTTSYTYDGRNRLIQITQADGSTIRFEYDAGNHIIRTIDPMGNTITYEYDNRNRCTRVLDGTGEVAEEITYNHRGDPVTVADALGNITYTSYDSEGQIIGMTRTTGEQEQAASYTYDSLGRITQTIDSMGNPVGITYDAKGNITSITDAEGGITSYEYDISGNLIRETNPIQNSSRYTYNARNLLEEAVNAAGEKTTYEYDALGRITSMTDNLGTIHYTYDKNSNVLTVEENGATIVRTYDACNRVTSYTDYAGRTIRYGYDEVGNLVTLTYPGGEIVRYEYNPDGTLEAAIDGRGKRTEYTYDANGQLTGIRRPDGTTEAYTYDKAGRLTGQMDVAEDGTVIQNLGYSYDGYGNITAQTGILPDPSDWNLTERSMKYDDANRLIEYNGYMVRYDSKGNMVYGPLEGVMTEFRYDCRNRLIQAGNTSYTYDAENNRIASTTDGVTTEYVINTQPELSQVLEEYVNHEVAVTYTYGNGRLIGETSGEKGERYYHYDNLGSTRAITDGKGDIRAEYSYGIYGELISGDRSQTGYLYNGAYGVHTDGNGLYYMRARYYNTDISRFINQDILRGSPAASQSLNRYAYCQGNPLNQTDPFGLCPQGMSTRDWIHLGLSIAGCIPVIGAVADIANAIMYFQEGDVLNGILSVAGACVGIGEITSAIGVAKGICTLTRAGMALKTAGIAYTTGSMAVQTIEGVARTYALLEANDFKLNRDVLVSAGQTMLSAAATAVGFKAIGSCIDQMAYLSARGLACFTAGTRVLTEEGYKNIEDIQPGDYVYSTDEATGESGYKEVLEVFRKETEVITHVYYEDAEGEIKEIETTLNHLFWNEGEWKAAGTLRAGDLLTLSDGSTVTVTGVTYEDRHTTVYNMEVADYHTYYVGEDSVWVHNTPGCGTVPGNSTNGSGSKPIGATYEGTIYRSVDSRYDPLEMSQYTINSNHRYTESGVPGLYFSSGEKIVKAELGNYDVFDFSNRTMYSYDVRLTNMLDVSNPSVRSQLGISLESIVGESYDVTHAIGQYAYSNGYNGIIAPSARADGGINIILFNAKGVK